MKTIYSIFTAMCLILAIQSCSQRKPDTGGEQGANRYPSPEAALTAAKENLATILNENQKKSYGLDTDGQIKNLSTTTDIPLLYLPLNSLRDTVINAAADARLYSLGTANTPQICVTVKKINNDWIIGTLGLKKYVNALQTEQNVTGVVEALGLEISLLQLQSPNGKVYKPLVDYPEARLSTQSLYSEAVILRSLEEYRATLEKQFGDAFSAGELER